MAKETESKKVFVSHAVVDKDIADAVIDLLQTGMGLKVPEDVFCCSLQGMKIPTGENFIDYVKRMIQSQGCNFIDFAKLLREPILPGRAWGNMGALA